MRLSLLAMIMIGFALSGCSTMNGTPATHNQSQKTINTASKIHYKDPLEVSFYPAGKPSKPFTVLGQTTVSKYNTAGHKRQEATIHDALRTKAASMGGDAIIDIQRDDNSVSGTVIAYQPKIDV